MNKDEFEDMMNETYPPYKILGTEFLAGSIIREMDPILFNVFYHDYINTLEEEVEWTS